jgi:Glycosyl transferase family 2
MPLENASAPFPVLAIVAPVRDEAPYLLEWIAYHRALGIDTFLLADNGGDDTTSELLQELDQQQLIKRFDWRAQQRFQLEFYRQALNFARDFLHGLFFIDADEFLRPQGDSISHVARKWLNDPTIGAVALSWAIYGSSGQQQRDDRLVIERFTCRAPQEFSANKHAKTFARVDCCAGPAENPHAVTLRTGRYVDTFGKDVRWDASHGHLVGITETVTWDVLRVDHFVLKSREEFEAKRARGRLITPMNDEAWEAYYALHDRNEVEDPMPAAFVERTKREIHRMTRKLRFEEKRLVRS